MSYEYFASSLPLLKFGEKPPFPLETLLTMAEGVLEEKDFAALKAIAGGGESDHPFVVAWRDCETEIKNAVAKKRAARFGAGGRDSGRSTGEAVVQARPHGGWHSSVESGVAAAFQQPDPLARHMSLLRLKWDLAQELAGLEPFGAAAVLAWAVRLGIAAHIASIDAAGGLEKFVSASSR